MSLHEISGGRDAKRGGTDSHRSAGDDGGSDREEPSDAAGHGSPSTGGPDGEVPSDAREDVTDHGGQMSALTLEGRESEATSPDPHEGNTTTQRSIRTLYTSVETSSITKRDHTCIGMQSEMGRPRTEPQSPPSSGATSDVHVWRAQTEERDVSDHHPASAQASGYLTSRE
jgi:hypothetical protein